MLTIAPPEATNDIPGILYEGYRDGELFADEYAANVAAGIIAWAWLDDICEAHHMRVTE